MDSACFAFTSGHAEAMCKANPPSVWLRSKKLPSPARVCTPAKLKDDRPQRPRLNFEDLPEAVLVCSRQQSCRLGRSVPGRLRVKSLGLPSCQDDPEAEAEEREAVPAAEVEDEQWTCAACTFLNCGLLSVCEMCRTEKGARLPSGWPEWTLPSSGGPWPNSTQGDEWPALGEAAESWVECDVSSVASSWLDVECADACLVDDNAGAFVVSAAGAPGASAPPAATWAVRAVAAPGQGAAVKAVLRPAAGPPLVRRAPAAKRAGRERQAQSEDEEDRNLLDRDLLDLEDRRLHPQTTRGAAHRMRMQRRRG